MDSKFFKLRYLIRSLHIVSATLYISSFKISGEFWRSGEFWKSLEFNDLMRTQS
jgi:hypothetical protein